VSGNESASAPSASFNFGGMAYSISGVEPRVLVYKPLTASINTAPTTPTEGQSFSIMIVINNPTGVSVSNLLFKLPVPSGLTLSEVQNAQVSGGVLTISSPTLAAHSSLNATGTAVASSGITVPFDKGTLTFTYQGVTINGRLPATGIAVGENVTTRYLIPIAIIFIVLLAVAFYVRRMAAPTVPASQQ